MITEQDIYSAIMKILKEYEKVSNTKNGLDFLLAEVQKLTPLGAYTISIQPLEELSDEDRLERKLPKIIVRCE